MNHPSKALLSTLIVLGLTACGGAETSPTGSNLPTQDEPAQDETQPDTDTPSTSTTDITDLIFENTSANCADYADDYVSQVMDVNYDTQFDGSVSITVSGDTCTITSNGIPNHNFHDGSRNFATAVSEQSQTFEVTASPTAAASPTSLTLSINNAIFLNGVKLDLLSAGCHGVGDGIIGCSDITQPWRKDPMSPNNNFGTDSHNAHTQPDGAYHYHGSPNAMFYDDAPIESPVIGFAADGFPIFGTYFDDNGDVRKATSSYQLKSGARQTIDGENPGGTYDGTYVDDYEYVDGLGDLDECNGMTVNGVYGYYVTESYPWVLGCFTGTPHSSFNK